MNLSALQCGFQSLKEDGHGKKRTKEKSIGASRLAASKLKLTAYQKHRFEVVLWGAFSEAAPDPPCGKTRKPLRATMADERMDAPVTLCLDSYVRSRAMLRDACDGLQATSNRVDQPQCYEIKDAIAKIERALIVGEHR